MYHFVIGEVFNLQFIGLVSLCCNDDDDDDDDDDDKVDDDDDDDVWMLIPLFRVIQAPRVNRGHEVLKDGKWVTFVEWSLCYTPSKHKHVVYIPVQ